MTSSAQGRSRSRHRSRLHTRHRTRWGWRPGSLGALLLLTSGAARAAGDGGLVLIPDLPLLVGLVVLFGLLVVPVNQLLFKPIFRVLDERDSRIAGTRARAVALEREADEVLARYEKSVQAVRQEAEQARRALLESARSDAQGTTGAARSDAEGEIDRARSEIAVALESAREVLRGESQQLAREAASRVLGRAL